MTINASQYQHNSPLGVLNIELEADHIVKLEWQALSATIAQQSHRSTPSQPLSQQLDDYFNQAHSQWTISLALRGTDFQQRVWQYLQTIPCGETRTYSQVSDALNSSPRAVGNACRANPVVIIVPCHRVVAKASLGGYAGQTTGPNMDYKQWLLEHERR